MSRRLLVSIALVVIGLGGAVVLWRARSLSTVLPTVAEAADEAGAHPALSSHGVLAAEGGAVLREQLIPARVRRLSNNEYSSSVHALLQTALVPGADFAPDARQSGFTENEAQRIDTVLAKQVSLAAERLASEARGRVASLAPCATPADPEVCAQAFIADFGARVYRRRLVQEESAGLLEVFRAGALAASYADGIELVVRALLQSAGFLYLTELGAQAATDGQNDPEVALTGHEIASELAYLITGGPPDAKLLVAAANGSLERPDERRSQLQRLRAEYPESRERLVRVLREWLQLDAIENTAKDITFYPSYELLWRHFITESHAFIAAVLDQTDKPNSDLSTLLAANWTVGDKILGDFYGAEVEPDGRLKLAARRGLLNQGAFLSVQAHARASAPVLRGALIARRLACIPVPAPGTVGISVLPPPPDPKLTTRQRFDLHATNPTCADCHAKIDDFGNAFEHYDGMGALRQTESELAVDSATTIAVGADFDGTYADSNALAEALARSPTVQECFARYLFRAAAARSGDSSAASDTSRSEDAFIAEWRTRSERERGNVLDTLDAWVSSRLFTQRRSL
ncbi:MAG: hypothetical protein RL701_221 [Pseudomonadota bacterium]